MKWQIANRRQKIRFSDCSLDDRPRQPSPARRDRPNGGQLSDPVSPKTEVRDTCRVINRPLLSAICHFIRASGENEGLITIGNGRA